MGSLAWLSFIRKKNLKLVLIWSVVTQQDPSNVSQFNLWMKGFSTHTCLWEPLFWKTRQKCCNYSEHCWCDVNMTVNKLFSLRTTCISRKKSASLMGKPAARLPTCIRRASSACLVAALTCCNGRWNNKQTCCRRRLNAGAGCVSRQERGGRHRCISWQSFWSNKAVLKNTC